MGNDHEDYETGAAPAAHKASHQDGGSDEISVAGLSGETAALAAHKILPSIHHVKFTAAEARAAINNIFGSDGKADVDINLDTHKLINVVDPAAAQDADTKAARDQAITTHTAAATAHQNAPQLILDHKGDASAHHAKYTDGEAQTVADARILIHKNIATAHQDAPQLILDHKGDASAHHAKYTDGEAMAAHNPISISPACFVPRFDTMDWDISSEVLQHRSTLVAQNFYAPVLLPHGVTITKITFAAYRDDSEATIRIITRRCTFAGVGQVMSTLTSNWTTGYDKIADEDVEYNVVDNTLYFYVLNLFTDPNDSVNDVKFSGALIEFTG